MISSETAQRSPPLDLRIQSVERQILERRRRTRASAMLLGRTIRARMIAPEMIAVAVAFGVYLRQRGPRHPNRSLATLVNSAYASRSVVKTLASWIRPAMPAGGIRDLDPSRQDRVA